MRISPFSSPSFFEGDPLRFSLPPTHGTTYVDFGVVMHVCGGEGLTRKVGSSIMEIIVTRRAEASLLAVECVLDVKFCTTSIAMVR